MGAAMHIYLSVHIYTCNMWSFLANEAWLSSIGEDPADDLPIIYHSTCWFSAGNENWNDPEGKPSIRFGLLPSGLPFRFIPHSPVPRPDSPARRPTTPAAARPTNDVHGLVDSEALNKLGPPARCPSAFFLGGGFPY